METLIEQGLVEEVKSGAGERGLIYDFSHEKLRALVYEQVSLARQVMVVFLGVLFVVLVHQIARLIVRRWRKPEPGVL